MQFLGFLFHKVVQNH